METQVLEEVKQIRKLLAKLVGTSDLPVRKQFSIEAIQKAALEFKKLEIQRGEWIEEHNISNVIRSAPYYSGKFIIEKFVFKNYFKHGRYFYFKKKDLLALKNELKKKNVHLSRYMELLDDQEKFKKKIDSLKSSGERRGRRFKIPDELKDITTAPYSSPSEEIVQNHIADLKEQFKKNNWYEYIDVYHDSHAMFKFEYYFDRYLDSGLKKQCKKWCDDFNYANYALKEIKKSKISSNSNV